MNSRHGVIALDIGGTKMACGVFLEDGTLLCHKSAATSQESAIRSVDQIAGLVNEAIEQCPRDVIAAALGVVVPGWVNRKDRTVWAPNIAGWDRLPLEKMLSGLISIPIVLDSDRSGYVTGECWLGVARGLRDVVFVAVGTGIGAGILADGRLVHGHDDLAGAVGWMALNPSYRDLYAESGCFEAEASGTAVGRKGTASMPSATGASSIQALTAREVIDAALRGNMQAGKIVQEAVSYLGMGVANLISTLNPEMVVLGGGLFQSGYPMIDAIRREVLRWAQPIAGPGVRIELSALGDKAGLYGAARIALDNC